MFIVGLTGGIGSGKSTVVHQFAELGIDWVDMDVVARDVVAPKEPALQHIAQYFCKVIPSILLADGTLNRPVLRDYIFLHPAAKAWLEDLLHPLIRQRTHDYLVGAQSPYALLVSPLLFENHIAVDASIVVDIPEQQQLARASLRDQNSTEQIQRIMATQMPRAERNAKATYVIDNSQSLNQTRQQVLATHQSILKNLLKSHD